MFLFVVCELELFKSMSGLYSKLPATERIYGRKATYKIGPTNVKLCLYLSIVAIQIKNMPCTIEGSYIIAIHLERKF